MGRSGDVVLGTGYRLRRLREPAPAPVWHTVPGDPAGALPSKFPCFHPRGADGFPDWLGEMFEWISASHEHAAGERDSIGRIPFAATLHGEYGLDPEIPYASVAMHFLNARIREVVGDQWPREPVCPWSDDRNWAVAATHDVDFFPVSVIAGVRRHLKNLAIACLVHKDLRLALSILAHAVKALAGGPSLMNCLRRLRQEEARRGISSTFLILCRRGHPRDANYELSDQVVQQTLREIAESGGEIGTHGSYTSLEAKGGLRDEFARMRKAGFPSVGNRQHWLRYWGGAENERLGTGEESSAARDEGSARRAPGVGPLTPDRQPRALSPQLQPLFEELVAAGAWYDATAGYCEKPGFRHGICSPFPPYDFEHERGFPFLELPLAIMDGALYAADASGRTWKARAERILGWSRALVWGGISVLWHDSLFSGAQLPTKLADLYWELARPGDLWTTGRDLVLRIWPRFAQAGLLPDSPPEPAGLSPRAAPA